MMSFKKLSGTDKILIIYNLSIEAVYPKSQLYFPLICFKRGKNIYSFICV